METPIVELKNIKKSFGKVLAVDDVSFEVGWGEIVGLVGDNGAGKSTIIRMIAGVYQPDAGEIIVRGQKMERWSVQTARKYGIETVYQDRAWPSSRPSSAISLWGASSRSLAVFSICAASVGSR